MQIKINEAVYKKTTSYNTNDQWLANSQTKLPMAGEYKFKWPMVGKYDVIFIGTKYKKLQNERTKV